MKIRILIAILFIFSLFLSTTTFTNAQLLNDNFNDGNADGWWLGHSHAVPSVIGNWRVENGYLIQDSGYDGVMAALENYQFSEQVVESKIKVFGPSGGAGIMLWYQGDNRLLWISLVGQAISISENDDGNWYQFVHNDNNITYDKWYTLNVEADAMNGKIKAYLDGEFKFEYFVNTTHRIGQTGFVTGNAGGAFDDFSINTPPKNKSECKNQGWRLFQNSTFRNQGDCIKYVSNVSIYKQNVLKF